MLVRAAYLVAYRSSLPGPDSFATYADPHGEFLPDRPLPGEHLLGLATGVLLYVLLRRLEINRWAAAAAAAIVLLDGRLIALEHEPVASPLFGLLVLSVLLLLLFLARGADWRWAGAVGLALALVTLMRREGIFLVPLALVYLLLPASGEGNGERGIRSGVAPGWRLRSRGRSLLALGLCLALPLLAFARINAGELGFMGASSLDGWFLYGRVAPFATCDGDAPEGTSFLCETSPASERNGPAFYVRDPRSPVSDSGPAGLSNDQAREWALYVIRAQPLDYLGTVGGQFLRYLKPSSDYRAERLGWEDSLDTSSRAYDRIVAVRGPLVVLLLALALYGSLRTSRRRAEVALMTGFALALMVVPVATVAFTWRSFLPALAPLVGAATCGASMLWDSMRSTGPAAASGGRAALP